jgi:hypothetical protein
MLNKYRRALPKELIDAKDQFAYLNPKVPPFGEFSEHAELIRPGRLIREYGKPGDELQLKEFDFGVPFGPIGWNYYYFKIVLQRIAIPGKPVVGNFIVDLASRSYGRYSGALPWDYDLLLLNATTPLRKIHLASELIEECHSDHKSSFQPPIPNFPGIIDFPLEFYNAVDNVLLYAGGNQESCN